MDYLEQVLNNYKEKQKIVGVNIYSGFYFEIKKDEPKIILWKDTDEVIRISSEKEYKNVIKVKMLKMKNIPEMLYAIEDKETAQNLYNVFANSYEYEDIINGIINVIKNQILKLDWS